MFPLLIANESLTNTVVQVFKSIYYFIIILIYKLLKTVCYSFCKIAKNPPPPTSFMLGSKINKNITIRMCSYYVLLSLKWKRIHRSRVVSVLDRCVRGRRFDSDRQLIFLECIDSKKHILLILSAKDLIVFPSYYIIP